MKRIRVGVTQAREDGEKSAALLEDAGFEPVLIPQICFAPTGESIPPAHYDLCLLTSPRVVETLAASLSKITDDSVSLGRVLAIHPRTAREAERAGFQVDEDLRPGNAAELVAAVPPAPPALDVLFPRGDLADPEAADRLRSAGHRVAAPVLYRTEAVAYDAEEVAALKADPPGACIFTSPSTFRNFSSRFGTAVLAESCVAVIGRTTKRAVEAAGVPVHVVPSSPSVNELIAELKRYHV